MRTCASSLLVVLALAAHAGCSSAPVVSDEGGGPAEEVASDSELDTLAFGTPRSDLEARFPAAIVDANGFAWAATYAGRPARINLQFTTGLSAIRVHFYAAYPSMDACGGDWAVLRHELDERFGRSNSDNLAAYWELDTRAIELACNPNGDDGTAAMHLSMDPPADE